jgi:diguanylate cyclase (GGDEF)-like protein
LERFVGKPSRQIHNIVLVTIFTLVHAYFLLVFPSLEARTINLSLGLLAICSQCAWLMLYRTDLEMRPMTRAIGIVFAGYGLISIARIVVDVAVPLDNDFFHSNTYDTLVLMTYQMLFIVLTFNLVLMVNRRLVMELERDILVRKQAEATIASLAKFPGENPNPIMRLDSSGIVLYTNLSAISLLQSLDSAVNHPLPASWQILVTQTLASQSGQTIEIEHAGRVYECELVPIREGNYVNLYARDITERKRAEEEVQLLQAQLREQAIRDPLTGLYNRRYLNETLERELARATREDYPVSCVMIDIDHFKNVNDTFGHAAGDAMLQSLGAQLVNQSRVADLVYRYGGEEFLVILPNVTAEIAFQIAERWRRTFLASTVLLQDSSSANATLSCGISEFPAHGSSGGELIAAADQAMYRAKAMGRNRVEVARSE